MCVYLPVVRCIVNLIQIYASRDSRDGELDYRESVNSHHAREKSLPYVHVVAGTHSALSSSLGWLLNACSTHIICMHTCTHAHTHIHTCTHIDGNAVGFSAERTGSDVTVSNCNGTLRSVITFSCDSDVAWYSSHNNVTNHLVSFLNDQADGCLVSTSRFGHTFMMLSSAWLL